LLLSINESIVLCNLLIPIIAFVLDALPSNKKGRVTIPTKLNILALASAITGAQHLFLHPFAVIKNHLVLRSTFFDIENTFYSRLLSHVWICSCSSPSVKFTPNWFCLELNYYLMLENQYYKTKSTLFNTLFKHVDLCVTSTSTYQLFITFWLVFLVNQMKCFQILSCCLFIFGF
jgi:hypothetical protein